MIYILEILIIVINNIIPTVSNNITLEIPINLPNIASDDIYNILYYSNLIPNISNY
jgi:hypothetical protein